MRTLLRFVAEVLLGLKPAYVCRFCEWHARGPRSLKAHLAVVHEHYPETV